MPVCGTCNGTDFTCLDGKFFCNECDTQSQDFVDEQAPELLAGPSFSTKQLRKRAQKDDFDEYIPWKTVEGFQQIIKAHIKALIEIGVEPELDGVMQQIWFKYVQKTGLAVISSESEVEEDPENYVRYRDFFLNKCEKLGISANKKRSVTLKISQKAKRSRTEQVDLEKDEEWFSVESDSAPESSKSESSVGENLWRKDKTRQGRWFHMKTMSMTKVICFCYLGLRWMEYPITQGDLVSWAEIGRLPYYRAAGCLAPHMKLQQYDHATFASLQRLDHEKVVYLSGKLCKYLEMPPLPKVDIRLLVVRYLCQLNLPLAFSAYVNGFITEIEQRSWPHFHRKHRLELVGCRSPELIAAAVIVVALKYLFVLNDEDEFHDVSGSPCPVHGAAQPICTNFTWKNWTLQYNLQRAKEKATSYTLFDDFTDPTEVGDVHACMEHQTSVLAAGAMNRSETVRNQLKEHIEARSFAFERLLDKQGSLEEKRKRTEMRLSPSNLYQQFARGDETCCVDFNHSCVAILAEHAKSRGGQYIRYSEVNRTDKLSDFHCSYSLLLEAMSRLTKSKWVYIQDYVNFVEAEHLSDPPLS